MTRMNMDWLVMVVAMVGLWGCTAKAPEAMNALERAEAAGWAQYGETAVMEGTAATLAEAGAGETDWIVEGTITEVCQGAGCWMRIDDGSADMLVRFRKGAFVVEKDIAGRKAVLKGRVEEEAPAAEEVPDDPAEALMALGDEMVFIASVVFVEPVAEDTETEG
jgi:hypothetical protein